MTVVIDGTSGINTPGVVNTAAETIATTLAVTGVTTLQGLTVGKGASAVATNTAVGASALAANTTGAGNTGIGKGALVAVQDGSNNTGVGRDVLGGTTSGASNTAMGVNAMITNTTGSFNTAIGQQALVGNTTASFNTAVGYQAGYTNLTGFSNTYIGYGSGNLATGTGNSFLGQGSGDQITSGAANTIIGRYNGNNGGLDIRTASNYIVLSDGNGNPRAWIGAGNSNDLFRVGTVSTATPSWMHQISYSQVSRSVLGITNDVSSGGPSGLTISYPNIAATAATDYFLYCTNSTTARAYIKNDGGLANFSANNVNLSDRREKTDFNPAGEYLSKICAIPVQTFRYIDRDAEDTAFTLGVVAQDVQAVAPELVAESDWSSEKDGSKVRLSVYQTDVQYALMKCIQEQQALITALTTRITTLEQA